MAKIAWFKCEPQRPKSILKPIKIAARINNDKLTLSDWLYKKRQLPNHTHGGSQRRIGHSAPPEVNSANNGKAT